MQMNTEIAVHPKLLHYGLTTGNLNVMLDWYRKVLGMTVNHRSALPAEARSRAPFSAMAFISNDETDHRIVLFEVPGVGVDPDKGRHARMQHIAFACRTLDDLLGTFVRLKRLGILPLRAADHGLGTAFYYAGSRPEHRRAQRQQLRRRLDGDRAPKDRASRDGLSRPRQDGGGAQSGRLALGSARAGRRWRVRS